MQALLLFTTPIIQSIIGSAIFEASKSGVKTVLNLPSEKEILLRIENILIELQKSQMELHKEITNINLNQDNFGRIINSLIEQFELNASVKKENGLLQLEVFPEETEKQLIMAQSISSQISEVAAVTSSETTFINPSSNPDNKRMSHESNRKDKSARTSIIALTSINSSYSLSPVFYDWTRRKQIGKALYYKINKKGQYSISRYQVNHFSAHSLNFIIAERNTNIYSGDDYSLQKANIINSLSDANNIVFDTNIENGYLIVKPGGIW